jgi:uncharacterized protein (TIGR03067 family)
MSMRFLLETPLATPVIVCLLLVGAATAQDRREAGAARDAHDLQGEWQRIDFQTRGITVAGMKNVRWIIQDDQRIEFNFGSNWTSQESQTRFRLDPAASPQQIDFVIHWRDPSWKDLTLPGIYSLDGQRLTICTNNKGKRPTEFKSTNENGNTLSSYQRVKGDPSVTLAFAKIQSDWAEANPMTVTAGTASELKRRMAQRCARSRGVCQTLPAICRGSSGRVRRPGCALPGGILGAGFGSGCESHFSPRRRTSRHRRLGCSVSRA